MAVWIFEILIYLFLLKKALNLYSAIGNCARICKSQFIWHYRDYCAVLNTWQKFLNSTSVSLSMSVSVSMSMSISVCCQLRFHFHVRFRFLVCFCVRVTLNMAVWLFMLHMATLLSVPKAHARCRGNLKGFVHERGWVKSVENLSASLLKRDLSNDTTFSQTYLTGQSF
jgi:hypothetical protein